MPNRDAARLAGRWRVLLICPNRGITSELTPLLAQHLPHSPVAEIPTYPTRPGLMELLEAGPSNLCFLDLISDHEKALSLLPDLLAIDPNVKIVALLGANDPDLILRCLRQGATEFLIRPFTADQFEPVVERLARFSHSLAGQNPLAKVYCVLPAKGACGASTIACALAFQLKRLGAKRVLLADLDPLTGTVSFLLKLKSSYSFIDALARSGTLDADLWRGIVTTCQGVDVLLSPETPVDGMGELRDPSSLTEYCRQTYDAVVFDGNGVYGDWSITLAKEADELLLVTTNELPALQATQRVLSYLDRHRVDRSKLKLLVNRFSREVGLNKEMIETALRADVFHLIPSDYEAVQKALMEGKPIPPSSSFGKSLATLAQRLAGQGEKEKEKAAPKAKKASGFSLLSIFSRD